MSVIVVIPAHNEERYICECLASLKKQTKKPSGIIVVADGCTDKTQQIADDFFFSNRMLFSDTKIVSLSRSKGYGEGMARNLNAALDTINQSRFIRCKFLMVLDADHTLAPNYIEDCLKAFDKNTVMVGGQSCGMDHNQPRGAHRIYRKNWLDQNPFPAVKSWDSFHFYQAKHNHFNVKVVQGVLAHELRTQGGSTKREFAKGVDSYKLGYSLPFLLGRAAKCIISKRVKTGLLMPFGFFYALGTRAKKHSIAHKINQGQKQRIKVLMRKILHPKEVKL